MNADGRVWNPMSQQYDPAPITLAGFLLARIADDEGEARGRLRGYPYHAWDEEDPDEQRRLLVIDRRYSGGAHRTLTECDAKRRIVDWHSLVAGTDRDSGPVTGCATCVGVEEGEAFTNAGPCLTLRLLALPYAGHPDYREEWRP